jgi:NUMOD4 motif/HNH endonuclease
MSEIWKPVPGYEGSYEVSNEGRIRSLAREVPRLGTGKKTIHAKIMTPQKNRGGYLQVVLRSDGKSKMNRIHRIVLSSFDRPRDDMDVNHKDGNKENNRLDNLEWATRSENIAHGYRVLGRKSAFSGRFGKDHHNAKAVIGINQQTGDTVRFDSLMDAQRAGFQAGHISSCLSGGRKKHQGFIWTEAA